MADVSVRAAAQADAATIARIQTEVWQTAFAGFLPPEVRDLGVEEVTAAWLETIGGLPSPRHHVLVAQEQNWVVGFAALAPADADEDTPEVARTALLGPILVQPRWGRRGHGSRLLAACVDNAVDDQMRRLICWLPEADPVSKDFLTSAGWQVDGYARALDTGQAELREIRLHTSLEMAA